MTHGVAVQDNVLNATRYDTSPAQSLPKSNDASTDVVGSSLKAICAVHAYTESNSANLVPEHKTDAQHGAS